MTDPNGVVTVVNRYDEYGTPQGGNYGPFQYTGQMWLGEIGIYNYKNRMYWPSTLPGGRFLQTDPVGYGAGMNPYAYVSNDPVNNVDPWGLQQECSAAQNVGGCDPIIVTGGFPSGGGGRGGANSLETRNIRGKTASVNKTDEVQSACSVAEFAARVDARIGGISYDTPGEKQALHDFMHGRTSTMRLGQGYLDRISTFYRSYPRQAVPLPSQPGDPAGSFRARITFANYDNSSINDPYLDGLIGQGTVLFDSQSKAIGLWDTFDFNAGHRSLPIEAGLADIRFGRKLYCGTAGSFPIRAGVAQ